MARVDAGWRYWRVYLVVLVVASVEVRRRYRMGRDEVSGRHGVWTEGGHRGKASTRNREHDCRWKAHIVNRSHAIEVSKCKSSTGSRRITHKVAVIEGGPHFALK